MTRAAQPPASEPAWTHAALVAGAQVRPVGHDSRASRPVLRA
ncbi:hypothetical protein ACF1GW_02695 [Streptomyces achromogenes]